jgi:hypothetical protein
VYDDSETCVAALAGLIDQYRRSIYIGSKASLRRISDASFVIASRGGFCLDTC